MKVLSLSLYGSCARGEETSTSDIDLFAIHDQKKYQMIIRGRVNIALYPKELAIDMMKKGNLFALHLKHEGLPVFNKKLFDSITDNFIYKECYSREITNALLLGNYIVNNHMKIRNIAMMNKRISWCVRTILIAKGAEIRSPFFSTQRLSNAFIFENTNPEKIAQLIQLKNSKFKDEIAITAACGFFNEIENQQRTILEKEIPDHFILKTIKRLSSDDEINGYSY